MWMMLTVGNNNDDNDDNEDNEDNGDNDGGDDDNMPMTIKLWCQWSCLW